MTTRQEQIDAQLRERQVMALERSAVAVERIADSLDKLNHYAENIRDYIDVAGDRAIEEAARIAGAIERVYPDPDADPPD